MPDVNTAAPVRLPVAGVIRATRCGTGRTVEDDEWHIWTFGPDGPVVEFRHLLDTRQAARRLAGPISASS